MKNLILAAVSVVALTAASGVNAQDQNQTQAPDTSKMLELQAPAASDSSNKMMELHAPAASSKIMKHKAAPHHKAHHHKKHHHKHHPAGSAYHPIEVDGVFITLPPMNPELYWGRGDCPYIAHGGYFWYPHARADLLANYAPYGVGGRYWYPSYMHPHMVYIDRAPLVYTYPYPLNAPHPMDRAMYKVQPAPMAKKWKTAPDVRSAEKE